MREIFWDSVDVTPGSGQETSFDNSMAIVDNLEGNQSVA